jgi:predicted nucleic acid-binding protein
MLDYVIADASVLIIFDKLNQFDILEKIYHNIYTTAEISLEFNKPLPSRIKVESVKDQKYLKFIRSQVDIGEATAIALAAEKDNPLLILDDLKARKLARRLGMRFTGTLGVINKAKELHIIDRIKPVIDQLRDSDFRISENIIENLLKRNNE